MVAVFWKKSKFLLTTIRNTSLVSVQPAAAAADKEGNGRASLPPPLVSLCPWRSVKKKENPSHFQTILYYEPWKPKKESEASLRS